MFTATIIDIITIMNIDGNYAFRVSYTDGTDTYQRTYAVPVLSDDVINAAVNNELSYRNNQSPVLTLAIGAAISAPALKAATVLTLQEQETNDATQTFLTNYQQLQALLRVANAGIISLTDPSITSLQTTLQASWSADYLGMV